MKAPGWQPLAENETHVVRWLRRRNHKCMGNLWFLRRSQRTTSVLILRKRLPARGLGRGQNGNQNGNQDVMEAMYAASGNGETPCGARGFGGRAGEI